MAAILSTASVPPAKRFEYWRGAVGEVFMNLDVSVPERDKPDFNGVITCHASGRLRFAEVTSTAQRVERSEQCLRRVTAESFQVLVQRSGLAIVEQDGRTAVLRPGEFALFNGTRPVAMTLPDRFQHDIIEIPGGLLRASIHDPEHLCAYTVASDNVLGKLFIGTLENVRNAFDEIGAGAQAACVGDALLALLGGAISATPQARVQIPTNMEVYHRERIRAVTRERLCDPELSIAAIAAQVRLSPSYVHRLFSSEPKTLGAWIWEQRLEASHRALLTSSGRQRSITEIAHSTGFKDLAHFSRMFKAVFGCSPSELREQVAQGQCGEPPPSCHVPAAPGQAAA